MIRYFIVIFLFMFFYSNAVFADINKAFNRIESYFNMKGIVIDENLIDLGINNGLAVGTVLNIFNEGDEIVHPVTGKVLGKKHKLGGSIVVVKTEQEFSEVKFLDGASAKVKDAVSFQLPVGVKFEYRDVSDNDRKIIDNLLAANSVIKNGDDYTVIFETVGNTTNYQIVQKDGTVIFSGNEASYVAPVERMKSSLEAEMSFELAGERFYSIAMGRFSPDDDKLYLAASTENEVFIFDPADSYRQIGEVSYKFTRVTNVETADLDGDGVDELFVSNILKDGKILKSVIFKHDGSSFKQVGDDSYSYFFRSVLVNGRRLILAQAVSSTTGGYKGEIFNFEYKGGKYQLGDPIKGSLGKNLFGFTYLEDNGQKVFYSINSNGNLDISTFKRNEYVSGKYYGDTINRVESSSGTSRYKNRDSEVENEAVESMNIYLYVNPRMEVIDDKYVVLTENELTSRAFKSSMTFKTSNISLGNYSKGMFNEVLKSNDINPIVTDVFAFEKDGSKYIAVVRCNNNWLFNRANSDIIIYKLILAEE